MAIYPSQYSFTQPVRYFKANDPYYYEVDNLPVRQLEENILWLKDQYAGFLGTGATGSNLGFLRAGDDIDLEWIKQFRPKHVNGRTIKVQSGRFIGRINDARREEDSNLADAYTAHNTTNSIVLGLGSARTGELQYKIWQNFTTSLGASESTLGTNCGLETAFTFYLQDLDGGGLGETIDPATGLPLYAAQSTNTGIIGEQAQTQSMPIQWHGNFPLYAGDNGAVNFTLLNWANLNRRHLELVRKWEGIYRTAVMDYQEEAIDIPAFSNFDYYKVNPVTEEAVSLVDIATQRLDLLVVYGHPVDASSSDLMAGFSNNAPLTITSPKLGIIRGAGIGVKNVTDGEPLVAGSEILNSPIDLDSGQNDIGSPKILANPNAERGDSNTGITLADGTVVNGSFPSPDDLGNLAASIAYNLVGDESFQLVGQCVLPICYVIVEKDVSTLSQEKIIDIRPFLRGTEFTYNERAGVAAANPPLSLANPAVGQAQLQNTYDELKGAIPPLTSFNPTQVTGGRATQQWWGTPWRDHRIQGTAPGAAPQAEVGTPTGTGNYATDGMFFNDIFQLPNALMAFGVGTVNIIAADHDGFSRYIGTGGAIQNSLYPTTTNPLYDGTLAYGHNNNAQYGPWYHQKFLQGIVQLNIDLSFYSDYATAELVAAAIKDTYSVAARAGVAGFYEAHQDNETMAVRGTGWRIVKRDTQYYLVVTCDMFGGNIPGTWGLEGSCMLIKKDITSTAGPTTTV